MHKAKILLLIAITAAALSACSAPKEENSQVSDPSAASQSATAIYGAAADRNPAVTEPAMAMIFVYRGNVEGTELERVLSYTEELTPQILLDKLIEYGILEDDTELLSFEITGDTKPGPGSPKTETSGNEALIGHLNLSKIPEVYDPSDEAVLINSLTGTFTDNYGLDGLELLINGTPYQSGLESQDNNGPLVLNMNYINVSEE